MLIQNTKTHSWYYNFNVILCDLQINLKGKARYKGWQGKPRDQVKNGHIKPRFYPERKEELLRDFSGKIYIVKESNMLQHLKRSPTFHPEGRNGTWHP